MKRALVDAGRSLYERGMLAGTDGNLSVRLDDHVLITPSGLATGRLAPDDIITIDISGKHLQGEGKASSEAAMHLAAYQRRPDVRACVHSHAPYATAFAVAGVNLGEDILPEVVIFVGRIPLADYAPPGTDEVPHSLEPFIETDNAFLLRNHGLVTIGRSLDEAMHRHEIVEHYAKIVFLARQLGNVDSIPPDDLQRLENMREKLDKSWDKNS